MRQLLCLLVLLLSTINSFTFALSTSDGKKSLTADSTEDIEGSRESPSSLSKSYYKGPTLWRWGQIPYVLDRRFGHEARRQIFQAFFEFRELTCINFHERVYPYRDYIYIYPGAGCFSGVGRTGGRQLFSLGKNCLNTSSVIHQLMHVLGFYHEHTRPDRDKYITILEENVKVDQLEDFEKRQFRMPYDDLPYDYSSAVHSKSNAHSANQMPTIKVKEKGAIIGRRKKHAHFGDWDVEKVKLLYACDSDHFKPPFLLLQKRLP